MCGNLLWEGHWKDGLVFRVCVYCSCALVEDPSSVLNSGWTAFKGLLLQLQGVCCIWPPSVVSLMCTHTHRHTESSLFYFPWWKSICFWKVCLQQPEAWVSLWLCPLCRPPHLRLKHRPSIRTCVASTWHLQLPATYAKWYSFPCRVVHGNFCINTLISEKEVMERKH